MAAEVCLSVLSVFLSGVLSVSLPDLCLPHVCLSVDPE